MNASRPTFGRQRAPVGDLAVQLGDGRRPAARAARQQHDQLLAGDEARDVVARHARARRERQAEGEGAVADRVRVEAVDVGQVGPVVGQRAVLVGVQVGRVVGVVAVGREVVLLGLVEAVVVADQARVGVRRARQPVLREALVDRDRDGVVGALRLGRVGQALQRCPAARCAAAAADCSAGSAGSFGIIGRPAASSCVLRLVVAICARRRAPTAGRGPGWRARRSATGRRRRPR